MQESKMKASAVDGHLPEPPAPEQGTNKTFSVRSYDLSATLASGQAFRWQWRDQGWLGTIGNHWVRLRSDDFSISAQTAEAVSDWNWLTEYLQLQVELETILDSFP